MGKGVRCLGLALVIGCGQLPTVWHGEGLMVRADDAAQARWQVGDPAAMVRELDAAVQWAVRLLPDDADEIRALRGAIVVDMYSDEAACGAGNAATYNGGGRVCVSWAGPHVSRSRVHRLPAHEFGHGVAYIAGIPADDHHDWMYANEFKY